MRRLLAAIVPIVVALPLGGSSSAVAAPTSTTLTAHLSGRVEVGARGPARGTGTATITVTLGSGKLCYSLLVSGFKLPATAAHIHAGRAGKSGPVVVPFPTAPGRTGRASGCTKVRTSILKAITGHPSSYYVNVHTLAYPGGAVRGQLM